MVRRYLPAALVALLILVADQLTKIWILGTVFAFPEPWHQGLRHAGFEITGFFNLVMVWNRGVSFGMFAADSDAQRRLLIAVTGGIALGMLIWLLRSPRPGFRLLLALIIGGAVGNLLDRVRFGAVADFLDFHVLGYHWPAFNIADAAITIGALLLAVDALFPNLFGAATGSVDETRRDAE